MFLLLLSDNLQIPKLSGFNINKRFSKASFEKWNYCSTDHRVCNYNLFDFMFLLIISN